MRSCILQLHELGMYCDHYWQASEASETLSGVYQFYIIYMDICKE